MKSGIFDEMVFRISTVFARVGVAVSLLLFLISLMTLPFMGSSTEVSYKEVKQAMNPPEAGTREAFERVAPDVVIPGNVAKHLKDDDKKRILQGWLESIEPDQQQDFLDNMSEVLEQAEEQADDPLDMIDNYKRVKMDKLNEQELGQYADMASRFSVVAFALSMTVLVLLMSVVLLLSAIERNTRPVEG